MKPSQPVREEGGHFLQLDRSTVKAQPLTEEHQNRVSAEILSNGGASTCPAGELSSAGSEHENEPTVTSREDNGFAVGVGMAESVLEENDRKGNGPFYSPRVGYFYMLWPTNVYSYESIFKQIQEMQHEFDKEAREQRKNSYDNKLLRGSLETHRNLINGNWFNEN